MNTLGPFASLAMLALLTGPATAETARSILSNSDISGMSCAAFARLSPSRQDDLVRQANISSPGSSLSSPEIIRSDGTIVTNDTGSVSGTPLMAGMIISACQAVSPTTSVSDAYARANSGRVIQLR